MINQQLAKTLDYFTLGDLKVFSVNVKKSLFYGLINLVMGICSNGAIINLLIKETETSSNSIWFFKIMENWLNSHNNCDYEDIVILADNVITHKIKEINTILENLVINNVFVSL